MKQRVFRFWLLSYLIVLFIPILITMIVLMQSQSLLVNEVRRANDVLLDQVSQYMDTQLGDIQRLGTQLSYEPKVVSYLHREEYQSVEAKFQARDIIHSLSSYTMTNGNIMDYYIYLHEIDYALTTSTYLSADDLYSVFHKNSGMAYDDWQQWVRASSTGQFITLNDSVEESENSLVYVQTLPIQEIRSAPSTLVVLLNQERLKGSIEGFGLSNQGTVYVLNRDGEPIMATGTERGLAEIPIDGMNRQRGFMTTSIGGKQAAVSYVKSEATGWTYISLVPESEYLAKVKLLKSLTYFALALCVLLGGLSAYWLTRRNYAPIRNMMDFVSSKVKANVKGMKNEYAVLESFMTESAAFQDEANKRMKEQHGMLRGHFLMRLMKGRVDTNAAFAQAFESYDLRFEEDRFAVMLFQVEDYSLLFSDNQSLDTDKKLQFVHHIVTNIAGDLAMGRYNVYFAESDGMIACLLNVSGKEQEGKSELLGMATEAQHFIQSKFYMRISIGVSEIHSLWSSIPRCYEEAVEALEYKLVLGASQVIAYDAIKRPKNELYYPLDTERQLINLMASGDYEGASDVLQRILMTNFSEGTLSIQLGKLLMFELVGTMLKAVEQFQLSTKEILVEKTEFIKHMTQCETFAEMEAEILSLLKEVCDYLQQKKKSHNADLKNDVVAHVLDNLTDMNISLTSISLAFGINPSYLSRFFKEQTGENLVDFINKRRIEKAKHGLEQSNVPIGTIAEQCGFASSQSLIRVFKKYEGVTPGQFRQNAATQLQSN